MVGVVQAYRHHDVSGADVGKAAKRLLNPELFQLYFAAFLRFLFPFAAFLVFLLVGDACAAVLEFNLRAHRPAFAEVVAHVDNHMRNVELPVRWVILMLFGLRVATHMVAVEVAAESHLAIATHAQSVAAGMTHYTVAGVHLCTHLHTCCQSCGSHP